MSAKDKLEISMVADDKSGDGVANQVRTSSSMFLHKAQNEWLLELRQELLLGHFSLQKTASLSKYRAMSSAKSTSPISTSSTTRSTNNVAVIVSPPCSCTWPMLTRAVKPSFQMQYDVRGCKSVLMRARTALVGPSQGSFGITRFIWWGTRMHEDIAGGVARSADQTTCIKEHGYGSINKI